MFFLKPRRKNRVVIKDEHGLPAVDLFYNNQTNEIEITINKPINLKVNGEFNITTFGDLKLDTWLSKLFLNSYNSKAIKDLPEAIEKREEGIKIEIGMSNWLEKHKTELDLFQQKHIKIQDSIKENK